MKLRLDDGAEARVPLSAVSKAKLELTDALIEEHRLAQGFAPLQARGKTAKIAEAAEIASEFKSIPKSRRGPVPKIGPFLLSVC